MIRKRLEPGRSWAVKAGPSSGLQDTGADGRTPISPPLFRPPLPSASWRAQGEEDERTQRRGALVKYPQPNQVGMLGGDFEHPEASRANSTLSTTNMETSSARAIPAAVTPPRSSEPSRKAGGGAAGCRSHAERRVSRVRSDESDQREGGFVGGREDGRVIGDGAVGRGLNSGVDAEDRHSQQQSAFRAAVRQ